MTANPISAISADIVCGVYLSSLVLLKIVVIMIDIIVLVNLIRNSFVGNKIFLSLFLKVKFKVIIYIERDVDATGEKVRVIASGRWERKFPQAATAAATKAFWRKTQGGLLRLTISHRGCAIAGPEPR